MNFKYLTQKSIIQYTLDSYFGEGYDQSISHFADSASEDNGQNFTLASRYLGQEVFMVIVNEWRS